MTRFLRPSQFLLFATVAMAPWCIGGTRADIQILLTLPILTSVGLAFVSIPERRSPVLWPVLLLLATVIPSCIQMLPMPLSMLEFLSPKSGELYRQANPNAAMAPISVDVLSTASAAIHQLIFGLVVVLVVLAGRTSTKTIAWIVVANGVLMTAVAMTHSLIGLEKILGVYESIHREKSVGFVGPFVNPNTLASYLVLSTFTAVGLAVSEEESSRLRFALIAGLITLAGVVLTESRGGLLALFFGCIFFLILAFSLPTEDRPGLPSRMRGVGTALVLALGAAAAFAWMTQEDWQSLTQTALVDDAKVRNWTVLEDWLGEFGTTGSGRGTFEYVYPQYQQESIRGTVTHAENIVVQMLAEYGRYIGSLILCLALVICGVAVHRFRTHRRGVVAGAVVGVSAVFIQQGLDFGLESMGLSLSVAALLGCLFTDAGERLPRRSAQFILAGPLMLGCILLIAFGTRCFETQGDTHLDPLRTASTVDDVIKEAEALSEVHPADGFIPLIAASRLMEFDPLPMAEILRWTNRSQRLWPLNGWPHEVAGRALLKGGYPSQAAGEFRRAMEESPWRTRPLLNILSVQLNTANDLTFATPDNPIDQSRLMNALMRNGRPDMVLAVSEELLLFEPHAVHLHQARARACLRIRDYDCIKAEVQFMDQNGLASLGRVFEARVAISKSNFDDARALLTRSLNNGEDPSESVLRQAVRAYADMGDFDDARACLNQLWLLSRLDSGKARDVLAQKARLEWRSGEYDSCRDAADRALTLLKSPDLTILAARSEVKLELLKTAEKRLWRARKRWPKNTSIETEHARVKSLLDGGSSDGTSGD